MNSWILTHDGDCFRWGLLSFLVCIILVLIFKALKFNPNLFRIPYNIYLFFVHVKRGRRYMANINGTWRVVRGTTSAGGYLHTDKLSPDDKEYCLDDDNYNKVAVTVSDDELRERIITINLRDLKMAHPLAKNIMPRGRPRDPFAEPVRQHNPYEEALRTLSPDMRAYMERELQLDVLDDE